jgi:phage protein D
MSEWPSDYVIETSSNWVERAPRPKKGDCHDLVLERRQGQWDAAKVRHDASVKRSAEIQAQREAAAQASRDQAAAAKDEARRQARQDGIEAMLRRRYLHAGGTAEGWAQERESYLAEHRRHTTFDGQTIDDQASAAQAGLYRSF